MKKNFVKVIGHITLPNAPIKHKCVCADCGDEVDDRFGDPRVEVKTFDSRDAKKPSSIRLICSWCDYIQFGDSSPYSIFG